MENPRQLRLHGHGYIQRKEELRSSIILETEANISFGEILSKLPANDDRWAAGFLAPGRFLIRAPHVWRREAIVRGDAELGGHRYSICRNLSEVSLQSGWPKIWIRLMGLPYEMRSVNAITKIVSDFGTLVEFDYNTAKNFDLRWARVKVCVADKSVIPPTLPIEITNDEDEMFTRNIVLQPEDNLSLPLFELSHQPGHTYNMSTQSPTGFQDDEPNNLPANSPPPLFEPPIISVDTSPNHITIPWLIPPIEPHAPLSQSNTQLLEDTAVLEYFFCQPPRWYGAGGAGTSAPELSCNAIAQMDKEHNTSNGKDDAAKNDQHNEVSEGTSRRKAGKKRKLNKKALASKRRMTFSPSRDELNEGVEHSRNLHDQESLDVAGEGGAPAEEQIDVSAYLANYDNTIQEPLDVTPLKVGAI